VSKRGNALISFGDMPWLLWLNQELAVPFENDFMILDEAQDFNPLSEWIVNFHAHENTQWLVVGDPWQAIQGFAGAANDAMDSLSYMLQEFDRPYSNMPLSQSFRCPASHVREAAKLGSPIQAFPWKGEGIFNDKLTSDRMATMAEVGDGILFRYNKDAVRFALKLIAQRKPAVVLGRTGNGVKYMFKKFTRGKSRVAWRHMPTHINAWCNNEVAAAKCEADEEEANETRDIALALYHAFPANSLNHFISQVSSIFTNESGERRAIELSTVHKAKGAEWRRVFLPKYDSLLDVRGVRPWQKKQEDHVRFVALTRAMEELYLAYDDNVEPQEEMLLETQHIW